MSKLSEIVTALQWVAPEFTGEDSAKVEFFAQSSLDETDENVFGFSFVEAMTNLTAHKLTRSMAVVGSAVGGGAGSGAGLNIGSVASIKVGDESINYSGSAAISAGTSGISVGDSELGTTKYGLAYIRLRDKQSEIGVFLA